MDAGRYRPLPSGEQLPGRKGTGRRPSIGKEARPVHVDGAKDARVVTVHAGSGPTTTQPQPPLGEHKGDRTQLPPVPGPAGRIAQWIDAGPYRDAALARVQPRPEKGHVEAVRYMVKTCCAGKTSRMTKVQEGTYDAMRTNVSQLMGSTLPEKEKWSVILDGTMVSSHFVETAMANNNLRAAASLLLGILEADTTMFHKVNLLIGADVDRLCQKLGRVPPQDQPWAQQMIGQIQALVGPLQHFEGLEEAGSVELKGLPDSPEVRACAALNLMYVKNIHSDKIECAADGKIEALEHPRYHPDTKDGRRTYVIPQAELQVR